MNKEKSNLFYDCGCVLFFEFDSGQWIMDVDKSRLCKGHNTSFTMKMYNLKPMTDSGEGN